MWLVLFGVVALLGIWGYKRFFSPEAVIEYYLRNQFNYNGKSIEEMQERRKRFLSDALLLSSQSSGAVEERKAYAITNGESCTLQDMILEKKEEQSYFFEVWYCLRYDTFEIEDKRMHVKGVMEVERANGLLKKISSIEVIHGCEEIMEKEYR